MEIIGYILSAGIGIVLGLLGGGGSILTLPVLVYVLGKDETLSTSYSLFIVGTAALVGAIQYARQKRVNYRAALVFLIPSALAVAFSQGYVLKRIPEVLYSNGTFAFTRGTAIMVVFSLIMLLASRSMIRNKKKENPHQPIAFNYPLIMLEGALVGFITGIVGAGGGFLIVPALTLLARLPIKLAIGTSLLIISGKSLFGFFTTIGNKAIEWDFLLIFVSWTVLGIFIGAYISKFVSPPKLKKIFGWFILVMAILIIYKELIAH